MSILVSCNGCFDGLHPGHLFFLGYAKAQGDRFIVGINSDDYIIRKKRNKPNFSSEVRSKIILSLGIVDEVVVFNEDDPRKFILRTMPNIHCIGEEYKETAIEREVVKETGGKICWVPRTNIWSTSKMSDVWHEWVGELMKGNI